MIWQRRITECAGSRVALLTRNLKLSSGVAAYGCGATLSISKLRSGTRRLPELIGPRLQIGEEPADLFPCLFAAGYPTPVRSDQSHQFEAFVNRGDEVFRADARGACLRDSIDQQPLYIRRHTLQGRIVLRDLMPYRQVEQRFGRPGGAGI